jgi:hypothetical protein
MYDDDEDREDLVARTLDEARENIKRHGGKPPDVAPPPPPDPLTRWKRGADERAVRYADERAAQRAEWATAARPAPFDWSAFDHRTQQAIQQALSVERKALAEAIGEDIGRLLDSERDAVLKTMRDEIREVRIECSKIAAQASETRARLITEHGEAQARQRDEIAKLRADIRELTVRSAHQDVEIARVRTELATERAKVIDTPGWPRAPGIRRDVN